MSGLVILQPASTCAYFHKSNASSLLIPQSIRIHKDFNFTFRMKASLFSASLTLLLTCGHSKESSSLRGNRQSRSTKASVESQIVLQGVVLGDPSANDLNLLRNALVSSHNDIHRDLRRVMHETQASPEWHLDHAESSSNQQHSRLSVSIMTTIQSPSPETTMPTTLRYSCGGCLCDDDNVPMALDQGGVKQSSSAHPHTSLEESFCNKIQSITSGWSSSYFLDINKCSIVFLDGPKDEVNDQVDDILVVDKKGALVSF